MSINQSAINGSAGFSSSSSSSLRHPLQMQVSGPSIGTAGGVALVAINTGVLATAGFGTLGLVQSVREGRRAITVGDEEGLRLAGARFGTSLMTCTSAGLNAAAFNEYMFHNMEAASHLQMIAVPFNFVAAFGHIVVGAKNLYDAVSFREEYLAGRVEEEFLKNPRDSLKKSLERLAGYLNVSDLEKRKEEMELDILEQVVNSSRALYLEERSGDLSAQVINLLQRFRPRSLLKQSLQKTWGEILQQETYSSSSERIGAFYTKAKEKLQDLEKEVEEEILTRNQDILHRRVSSSGKMELSAELVEHLIYGINVGDKGVILEALQLDRQIRKANFQKITKNTARVVVALLTVIMLTVMSVLTGGIAPTIIAVVAGIIMLLIWTGVLNKISGYIWDKITPEYEQQPEEVEMVNLRALRGGGATFDSNDNVPVGYPHPFHKQKRLRVLVDIDIDGGASRASSVPGTSTPNAVSTTTVSSSSGKLLLSPDDTRHRTPRRTREAVKYRPETQGGDEKVGHYLSPQALLVPIPEHKVPAEKGGLPRYRSLQLVD